MDISVVIPLLNEEESLPELIAWLHRVMKENNYSYEIVLVDDGSTDNSWKVIESLHADNQAIRGIRFRRNYGKSAALNAAFEIVEGTVVITMDADLQDSPDEIPALYKMITEEDYDVVSGWKKVRYDSKIAKNIPSKFFNWTTRRMSKIPLHDFNCGLKAYKKEVVKTIEIYGDMHRYIPVIAKWAGFHKIGEKVVQHQKRKYGTTKFGWNRFVNGYLDLITINFISRFGKKPMHFFGLLGSLFFLLGGGVALVLIIQKLVAIANQLAYRQVTDQPLFYIALLAMILGLQLFLAGFLGELISRSSNDRNKYLISKKI
ncbi:MAG TPA: glycosyltransferase family 2 protein [Bacteroidales bacterium]|nr:glycosyltransferase family 2 protein [Bacteroidales bacterium]HOS57068.1 glycosyltransferase family 2 protein [Bacteroidales bacterium]HRR03818.1 glycosyltransferase family 2 protein [Bacteroidales bacterium]HRT14103.1 glycosyltransferase family 2 protein [Bacteroidales bacterium]